MTSVQKKMVILQVVHKNHTGVKQKVSNKSKLVHINSVLVRSCCAVFGADYFIDLFVHSNSVLEE